MDASGHELNTTSNNVKYNPSGIVVLFLCKRQRLTNTKGLEWGQEHYKLLQEAKKSIMTTQSSHFGSQGK